MPDLAPLPKGYRDRFMVRHLFSVKVAQGCSVYVWGQQMQVPGDQPSLAEQWANWLIDGYEKPPGDIVQVWHETFDMLGASPPRKLMLYQTLGARAGGCAY
jgi:hypothetical protein